MKNVLSWTLRIVAAVIMLQTLYFKFTAAPESVYIFTTIGLEPFGRIGIGVMELIASALILFTPTLVWGALLAMGLMSGAIFFHITKLGIEVQGDGGQLFYYALIVFIASGILVLLNIKKITAILQFFKSKLNANKY